MSRKPPLVRNQHLVAQVAAREGDAPDAAPGFVEQQANGDPCTERAGEARAPREASVLSTILLADECSDALDILSPALERGGHRVLRACTGKAALDVFVRERPDVVIVHHALLGAGATEFVRGVRVLAPAVPIIVRSNNLTEVECHELTCDLDVIVARDRCDDPEQLLELVCGALAAKRCARRIHDNQELRGLILAKLCHHLRTPLHVIRGYTDILRTEYDVSGFKDILDRMITATDGAINLVQDYLDLARLDAPGLTVHSEEVDIDELVGELQALAEREIGERPLRLITCAPLTGAVMNTDGEKLRAILGQLLANAIKFTPEGVIRLFVQSEAESTDFVLVDAGPGISEQDFPILYAPFRQQSQESLASTPGQGIGLAIAQRLSTLIGASLTAETLPGGGAAFTLSVSSPLVPQTADLAKHTLH